MHSMPGCEQAKFLMYGYAVEYDMVRPHQIYVTGQTRLVDGFYLAGQINGTSGYEEAAAQGLVAGINAAMRAQGAGEFSLDRSQGYMGVLMDDLVTKTPREPYRMFTSRAEYRLLLRSDNAPDRLTPIAIELGLLDHHDLGTQRKAHFARRTELIELGRALLESTAMVRRRYATESLNQITVSRISNLQSGMNWLKRWGKWGGSIRVSTRRSMRIGGMSRMSNASLSRSADTARWSTSPSPSGLTTNQWILSAPKRGTRSKNTAQQLSAKRPASKASPRRT